MEKDEIEARPMECTYKLIKDTFPGENVYVDIDVDFATDIHNHRYTGSKRTRIQITRKVSMERVDAFEKLGHSLINKIPKTIMNNCISYNVKMGRDDDFLEIEYNLQNLDLINFCKELELESWDFYKQSFDIQVEEILGEDNE